ncbi:hypothetical protein EST38_g5902 [Candolleomyces aberdarensis]|uniref:Uncharacterized protein n=1 Tax=Candolleomyces aberdarensis TaxID=2316362 RepID=A0A4Q2DJD3_9AGAR|nr:hypothetical protein EST38_g5902 [Candolleomyces aberdarensis]
MKAADDADKGSIDAPLIRRIDQPMLGKLLDKLEMPDLRLLRLEEYIWDRDY